MKARIGLTLAIILVLASLTAVVPKALAGDHEGEGCSVKLLEGSFGYAAQSFVLFCLEESTCGLPAAPSAIGSYAPFALAGTISFDGKGNVTGVDSINLGFGAIPRTYTGTYTVVDPAAKRKDCAFTATFVPTPPIPPVVDLYMVLARDGKVLELVNTDPGAILAFPAEKK